jgi:hypothetical protein
MIHVQLENYVSLFKKVSRWGLIVGASLDETIGTLKFMLWQAGHKDFQLKQ